jgi:hypothetical protein
MAEKDFSGYKDNGLVAAGDVRVRRIHVDVDFSEAANQLAGATDNLNLFELPVGSTILSATIEQQTVGTASNTMTLRSGSTAITAALAGDAAVGTVVATTTGVPLVVTTAADLNLLSAAAVRVAGKARVSVVFVEGKSEVIPKIAPRDALTGLA